jgi:hypothetical protein
MKPANPKPDHALCRSHPCSSTSCANEPTPTGSPRQIGCCSAPATTLARPDRTGPAPGTVASHRSARSQCASTTAATLPRPHGCAPACPSPKLHETRTLRRDTCLHLHRSPRRRRTRRQPAPRNLAPAGTDRRRFLDHAGTEMQRNVASAELHFETAVQAWPEGIWNGRRVPAMFRRLQTMPSWNRSAAHHLNQAKKTRSRRSRTHSPEQLPAPAPTRPRTRPQPTRPSSPLRPHHPTSRNNPLTTITRGMPDRCAVLVDERSVWARITGYFARRFVGSTGACPQWERLGDGWLIPIAEGRSRQAWGCDGSSRTCRMAKCFEPRCPGGANSSSELVAAPVTTWSAQRSEYLRRSGV